MKPASFDFTVIQVALKRQELLNARTQTQRQMGVGHPDVARLSYLIATADEALAELERLRDRLTAPRFHCDECGITWSRTGDNALCPECGSELIHSLDDPAARRAA